MTLLLWIACAETPDSDVAPDPDPVPTHTGTEDSAAEPSPTLGEGVTIAVELPDSPDVRLVRVLTVDGTVPTALSVRLTGADTSRTIDFPGVAKEHRVPLLALRADETYDVVVTLVAADDPSVGWTSDPLQFSTQPLDLLMPIAELIEPGADAAEPRYTLMALEADDTLQRRLVVYDLDGEPVWVMDAKGTPKAATLTEAGDIVALVSGEIGRLEMTGAWVPLAPTAGVGSFHHDVHPQPDGSFFSLHKVPVAVSGFPTNPNDLTVLSDVMIDDDVAIHVAADGSVVSEWSMAARLEPTRVGYDSSDPNAGGTLDWAHANAIQYLPEEDALIVSLRHQDAVVKIDAASGDLVWILGNHDGWPVEFEPFLLDPVGFPFSWHYHQHAPMIDGNQVVMFDNGNHRRTTPYADDPTPLSFSRVVEYLVDPVSMTVSQTWQDVTGTPPLFSQALGDADWLPSTGHVLAVFSFLHAEDDVNNLSIGRGDKSVRIVELDPTTGDTVWDLGLHGLVDDAPKGWQVDRVQRIPSLYGTQATEIWLDIDAP